jgi:hypothetical protein
VICDTAWENIHATIKKNRNELFEELVENDDRKSLNPVEMVKMGRLIEQDV